MSTLDALLGRREAPDQVTTGSHSRVCARLGVVLGVPACLLLLLLIGLGVNARPAGAFGYLSPMKKHYQAVLAPASAARSGDPGTTVTYTLVLTNAGNGADAFTLTVGSTAFTTRVTPSSVGPLAKRQSRTVTVTVRIPANAAGGLTDTATLTATSRGDASQSASSTLVTMASTAWGVYLPLLQKSSFCDQYEPNDNRPINGGTPWGPLTSGQIVHSQICPGDPRDLYYFNAGGAAPVTIDLTDVPGNADFGLYLWNESGAASLAGSRKGTGQNEHIVFALPGAGRYYIDVYPWSGSGPYTLQSSGW